MSKRIARTIRTSLIAMVLVILASAAVFAAEYKIANYSDTRISKSDFDTILATLRDHKNDKVEDGSVIMIDTGITASSDQAGKQLAADFRNLFLGEDDFAIWYNHYGSEGAKVQCTRKSSESVSFKYTTTGRDICTPTIYIAWIPGSDPEESLRQHDTATEKLSELGKGKTMKDFYNWLCGNVEYDKNLSKKSHTAYAALVENKAVCDGISGAFQAYCFMNNEFCAQVDVEVPEVGRHAQNIVKINGEYKMIDATWGEATSKSTDKYFCAKVSETWKNIFNKAAAAN